MTKKLIWAIAFVFIASFIVSPHVNAAEANYFDVEFSSDKDSYELDDEVSSTITISNSSEVYDAENVEIKTTLPEEFDVVDEDIEVEDGEIIWDVDQINHGESTELTVKTKLKQSVIDKTTPADENDEKEEDSTNKENENKEDEKNADDEEETDQHAPTADVNDNNQGTDGMVAPQTGDDSSILTYVLILIVSVVVGAIALFLIRKKSLSKTLPFILAFALLTPVASVAAEVDKDNVETNTTNHELTIGDDTYQLETTITGEMNDNRGQIPVTGTAYNANGDVLTNEELTFTTTVDGETIDQLVQTDEEGYFVARLFKNASYDVHGTNVQATVKAVEQNDIDLSNETGEIELGKKLTNGDNFTDLQPSVIYLSGEENAISNVSDDLSSVTISGEADIQANDLIVIPEWDGYPAGIAVQVESISSSDGQMILQVKEPELEEIFEEIHGDIEVDITSDNFVPASGVTIKDNSGPEARGFSTMQSRAAELDSSVELDLSNVFSEDQHGFSMDGSLTLNGKFIGDISWGWGLNPVKELDFQFKGDQVIDAEFTTTLIDTSTEVRIGEMIIPTNIPGITVGVPVDLLVSANGEVSLKVATGMREEFGILYEKGSGVSTYPDKHFDPFFQVSSIDGKGTATTDLKLSVLVQGLTLDLAGAAATGGVTGDAEARINGEGSAFTCAHLAATFNSKLNLTAPIADWESDGITYSEEFASTELGNCMTSIQTDPSEIEINPGETESIHVVGSDGNTEANIHDYDHFDFEVSDENSIQVASDHDKIDITATEAAQDGDVVEVKVIYDLHGETLTDTLEVTIVDDRETGELIGQVVDAMEDTAIAEADVKVHQDGNIVTEVQSDNNGNYTIDLAPGEYKLEVSHAGYITDTTRVKINAANTTTYDSKLQLVDEDHAGDGTASGQIKDAVTGEGVPNVSIDIRQGKNNTSGDIIESLTTDDNGFYSVELPGGNYTMALSADGYISSDSNILTIGGEEKGNQDATISLDGVTEDDLRIVLTWGENPRDLDSHITGPRADEGRFHVYYPNKSYKDEANDVNLDRDDITSYGPETVTVLKQIQDGTYTYAVHNFTGRYLDEDNQFDLSNSGAKVQVYRGDTLLETFNVPLEQAGNSWNVLEIRNGEIVPINTIVTIEDWNSADAFAPVNN